MKTINAREITAGKHFLGEELRKVSWKRSNQCWPLNIKKWFWNIKILPRQGNRISRFRHGLSSWRKMIKKLTGRDRLHSSKREYGAIGSIGNTGLQGEQLLGV